MTESQLVGNGFTPEQASTLRRIWDTKREYRCTRNEPYNNPNCPGHKQLSARQGYYLMADSVYDALSQMRVKFPYEDRFTAKLWLS